MSMRTDYGHPERAFFKNLELLGLGRHFRLKLLEAFGLFLAGLTQGQLQEWTEHSPHTDPKSETSRDIKKSF